MPGNTAYCLAKGGMRMLTRTAGVELGAARHPGGRSRARGGFNADQSFPRCTTLPCSRSSTLRSPPRAHGGAGGDRQCRRLFSPGDGASYLTATTIFADGGIMQSSVGL